MFSRHTWNKRIEGQIRDCFKAHPDYVNPDRLDTCVRSLRKRIAGEVMSHQKRNMRLGNGAVPSESEADKS